METSRFIVSVQSDKKITPAVVKNNVERALRTLSHKKFKMGTVQSFVYSLDRSQRLALELIDCLREEMRDTAIVEMDKQ